MFGPTLHRAYTSSSAVIYNVNADAIYCTTNATAEIYTVNALMIECSGGCSAVIHCSVDTSLLEEGDCDATIIRHEKYEEGFCEKMRSEKGKDFVIEATTQQVESETSEQNFPDTTITTTHMDKTIGICVRFNIIP